MVESCLGVLSNQGCHPRSCQGIHVRPRVLDDNFPEEGGGTERWLRFVITEFAAADFPGGGYCCVHPPLPLPPRPTPSGPTKSSLHSWRWWGYKGRRRGFSRPVSSGPDGIFWLLGKVVYLHPHTFLFPFCNFIRKILIMEHDHALPAAGPAPQSQRAAAGRPSRTTTR